jgi:carboxypeptidase Q
MRRQQLLVILAVFAFAASTPIAQEKIDSDMVWKIRREAIERSQILDTLHVLTDVYGPRLTGSPNAKAAGEWVVKRSTEWGLKNAHLEPWDFGHDGWLNERTSAFIVSPIKDTLVVETLAWTPSTSGSVIASVVQIDAPGRVTKEQLTAYFEGNRAKAKGKIVMVGAAVKVPVTINKPSLPREPGTRAGRPARCCCVRPARSHARARESGFRTARSVSGQRRSGRAAERCRSRSRADSRL